MNPTKFSLLRALILVAAFSAAASGAQKPSPEQKPDVSNKALITKQTPNSKKKTAETKAVKQYTIEQFMGTIGRGGAWFSSDEKSFLFHGNIFQDAPTFPFADTKEQAGTWGVETEFENVFICGSSAHRGGRCQRHSRP